MTNIENKVRKIMAEVFLCQIEGINKNTTREDIDNWDSLQHLMLASKLESEFGIRLTPKEINSMTKFQTIVDLINIKIQYEV